MKSINKGITGLALVAAVAVVGCSPSKPPRELLDARTAYERAARSPNAGLAAVDVHDAREALGRAERHFDDKGGEQSTRDLAYIAHRKAVAANAAADATAAMRDKQVALQDLENARQRHATAIAGELDQTKEELSQSREVIANERQARTAADQRAQEALSKIAGLKTERSERGLVLTMSGAVLFASAKSVLLPSAREALDGVAEALKNDDRSILIVGHTDAQGAEEKNLQLSERRADAVKKYLAQRGMSGDRIRTQGMGESQPVANNESPEGRANNRRVEIIVEDASPSGQGSQPPPGQGRPGPL